MNQETKSCLQCGATGEQGVNLITIDTTGRLFCSRAHGIQFYESRGSSLDHANSNSLRLYSEVLADTQSNHELYGPKSPFARLSPTEQVIKIDEKKRAIERLRDELRTMEVTRNESATRAVTLQIEQTRKFGSTAPAKATKLQGQLEKSIASWWKANFSDPTIVTYITFTSHLTAKQAQIEIDQMRAAGKIGPPRSVDAIKNAGGLGI